MTPLSEQLAPQVDRIVRRMFVETADKNYILARVAFFFELDWDFLWLSLHAVEKYCKAVLLYNGASAPPGHNLLELQDALMSLDEALRLKPFDDPKVDGVTWYESDCLAEHFLRRLNHIGSPSNRYGTYGYHVVPQDLLKVDQLVWSVRRFCRPLRYVLGDPEAGSFVDVDELRLLSDDPRRWQLGSLLPLEQLLAKPVQDVRRAMFVDCNVPFAPDLPHEYHHMRYSSSNAPLPQMLEELATSSCPEYRREVAAALQWVVDHAPLTRKEKRDIKKALASAPPTLTSPPA